MTYRLPTEAEWELAARGPSGRRFPWGETPPGPKHANIAGDADGYERLAPVGSFPKGATPQGIVDLFGNAGEWCRDCYGRYPKGAQKDPSGPPKGEHRTARGGSYAYTLAEWPAASTRGYAPPDEELDTIGFRVVRELTADEREFERLAKNE